MKKWQQISLSIFTLATAMNSQAEQPSTQLFGYSEGATVLKVEKTQTRIDPISDIIYSQINGPMGHRNLKMSLLVPNSKQLKPAIVYLPGGGFMGANHDKYIQMRMALANADFVVASIEYRVVPDMFPAPVVDAKAAVRYLRAHAAEFGIDPTRIAVLGDSAGGWLSQMVALSDNEKAWEQGDFLDQSSAVQAAVSIYGFWDLQNIGEGFPDDIQKVHQSPAVTEALLVNGPAFNTFAGASITSDPQKALNASPKGHIKGKKPPFLIIHGSSDTLVSPLQSKHLYDTLKAEGNQADYVLIEGAGHGTQEFYQPVVINKVVDWFKQHLGSPVDNPQAKTVGSDL
ncbi:MAG: alpha/beta hydrolase [Pasteurellaceae bacterium]|nr:alpha/beta hydrolase [Pasteurellaceae bacterium]